MKRIAANERPDWRDQAQSLGFHFHTIDGAPYWDERAYYAFGLRQIEDDIEQPTQELHDMSMALVDEVVGSEELLTRLAIPATHWDWIADSWRRGEPHLYGRMDLAYDGVGPAKLYELNYDTPTSLYEAAYFQWLWLEQNIQRGVLPQGSDQYNRIQELLIETFGALALDKRIATPVHFAAVEDSVEDQGTVRYLRDCAEQAGVNTLELSIEGIGMSAEGWFTDGEDRVIRTLFKLYPLEWMFVEEYGAKLAASQVQLIEPAWKAILSNKGVLPLLWERHRGHRNLLEAYFDEQTLAELSAGWVRKPLFSREGANIELVDADGQRLSSDGPYAGGPTIRQALHPLPRFDGADGAANYPLIGSWVVADNAAGMGIREDAGLITQDTSRFVPHAIVGD
ncbi:glutathionylspermidine synthase family protein [Lysobacter gummosus]|uniref:Glutathionylspermidine synthase family protein n=1 Tax=Lysobacter gummosus TaxID=262324 RepID=A0ABY3XAQ8_9GAMM|nr:glutathionylspermidine synthase family protein [Lysobacter gummosus]ALN94236.1 glutathionylspermidine synthase preATP-grasp family protein [Lysobacter gummosus]UNP29644.1 glutathionylspermidine synthase family protein [Lysobacter gummosus]